MRCCKHVLLDYLVCSREQHRLYVKIKGLSRRKIDDQFELGRLHHWYVNRSLAPEDTASVDASLAILVGEDRSVTYEPTDLGKLTIVKHCRYRMTRRECCDLYAPIAE